MTIDKGSTDGIARGHARGDGTAGSAPMLVGKVVEVAENDSAVRLIIDRSRRCAGVLGTSQAAGLVEGQGEQDLTMGVPDRHRRSRSTEAVFTQGYCVTGRPGVYPPGILVGTGVPHGPGVERRSKNPSASGPPSISPRCSSCWS